MFFKDIDSWTKKKLRLMTILWVSVYFIFATIIPIIIIMCKYQIFKESSFKLTGSFLVVVVILLTAGIKTVRVFLAKLPEVKIEQQRLKYSLELILAAIPIAIIVWIVMMIKKDMDLALNTIMWCVASYLCAIIVDAVCVKSLMFQWKAQADVDYDEKKTNIAEARRRNKNQ